MESHRENVSSRVPRIPDVEERDGLADKGHRRWNRPDLKREIRAEGGRGQKEPCSTIDQGFATMAVGVRLQQTMGRSGCVALLFAMALAGAGFGQVPLDESGHKSTVNVVIVDSFGLPVDSAILYMQRVDAGDEGPRIRIQHWPLDPLPYGTYRLTVEHPGFEAASRVVAVYDKNCTVIIGLIPAEIESRGDPIYVTARIRDSNISPACRWVRLVPIFAASEQLDAVVYQRQFLLTNAKPGLYDVVVFGP